MLRHTNLTKLSCKFQFVFFFFNFIYLCIFCCLWYNNYGTVYTVRYVCIDPRKINNILINKLITPNNQNNI